jgi:hypothetical protein
MNLCVIRSGVSGVQRFLQLSNYCSATIGLLDLILQSGCWAGQGGAEIVAPLTRIPSRSDDSLKLYALESLANAPPYKAIPVVQEVLYREKSKFILEEAASVLERLKSSEKN